MSIVIEVLVALGAVFIALIHFLHVLVLRPRSLRAKLHRQGIDGPSPHFYFGNIKEMKTLLLQQQTQVKQKNKDEDGFVSISHSWTTTLFPHIHKWTNQYGQLLCPLSYLFVLTFEKKFIDHIIIIVTFYVPCLVLIIYFFIQSFDGNFLLT